MISNRVSSAGLVYSKHHLLLAALVLLVAGPIPPFARAQVEELRVLAPLYARPGGEYCCAVGV